MSARSIDERRFKAALSRVVRDTIRETGKPGLAEETVDVIREWLADYLERQPRAPHLVGPVAAARLLGVQPPHLARLRRQGRMPEPIPVEGTNDVYVKEDVEALAVKLAEEREARAVRRAQKGEERDAAA